MATGGADYVDDADMCKFCGDEPVARICSAPACARKHLCASCDEIWHGHPDRRRHERREVHPAPQNGHGQPLTQPQSGFPWSCPHCTFENVSEVLWKPDDRLMCEVCSRTSMGSELAELRAPTNNNSDQANPSTEKSIKKSAVACTVCTFLNTAQGAKRCEVCDAELPQSSKNRPKPRSELFSAASETAKGIRQSQRQLQGQAALNRLNADNSNQGDQEMPGGQERESQRRQAHVTEVQDRVEQKRQRKYAPDPSIATADTSVNLRSRDTAASSSGSHTASVQTAEAPMRFDNNRDLLYQQQLTEKELQMQLAELKAVEEAEKRQMTERQLQQREQQMQQLQMRLAEEERQRIETEERLKDEASEREWLQSVLLEQQRSENERRERARIEDEERREREAEEIRWRKRREEEKQQRREREEAERQKKEREKAEQQRWEREEAERQRREREEAERQRKEREEAERQRKEREEAERLRKERDEVERQRKVREETERQRKQREEEWLRKEREEAERQRWQREQTERLQIELAEEEHKRKILILRNTQAAEKRKRREEQERLLAEQEAGDMTKDLKLIRHKRLHRHEPEHGESGRRFRDGERAGQMRSDDKDWQMTAVVKASGLSLKNPTKSFSAKSEPAVLTRRTNELLRDGVFGPENQITSADASQSSHRTSDRGGVAATGYEEIDNTYTSDDSDDFEEPQRQPARVAGRMSAQKSVKLQCAHCGKSRDVSGRIEAVGFQCFSCYSYTCKMCGILWENRHTGRSCQEFASLPGRTTKYQSIGNRPKVTGVDRPASVRNPPLMHCKMCHCTVDTNMSRDATTVYCRNCGSILHLPRPY